jgi:Sec-independent protein translocase protein TatA
MPDVLFILLLALVVFGPRKLPEIAAKVGRYMAHFPRMRRELLDNVSVEVLRLEREKEIQKQPDGVNRLSEPALSTKPEAAGDRYYC